MGLRISVQQIQARLLAVVGDVITAKQAKAQLVAELSLGDAEHPQELLVTWRARPRRTLGRKNLSQICLVKAKVS